MRVNYQVNSTPQFAFLSRHQCGEIYTGALQVLQETGFKLHSDSPEISDLLAGYGALVDGKHVRLPSSVVQAAIAAAPKTFAIYGRDPSSTSRIRIAPNHIHYGLGSGCITFLDPRTAERRQYARDDAAAVARVADALPNIDFIQSLGTVQAHPELTDVVEFAEMLINTTKPLVAYARTLSVVESVHRLALAVAGGQDEFRKHPNYLVLGSPASPLFTEVEPTKRVVYCAQHYIPYISCTAPTAGGTSPATMAGTLVQSTAEVLSELVIAQAAQPGSPFLAGGVLSAMDMRTGILPYGAPELAKLCAAFAEIWRYVGLPFYSTAGATDSKILDAQAALEGGLSILVAGLSGANLIHDTGFIESAMTGSLQHVVLMDEVMDWVKNLLAGVRVDQETLAVDVIGRVGPGGEYLTDDHTMAHFKSEFWFPTLFDRKQHDTWLADGATSLNQRVQHKLNGILDSHEPPALSPSIRGKIDDVLAEVEARARDE
jgi:trimethylamine--corrinoid protein Co-methyltransferase